MIGKALQTARPSAPPSGNLIWPPCPLTKMKGLQVGTDRDNSWTLVLQV